MNKTTWWIVGLIALVVVSYGGYRVIKHFARLAATPAAVSTMTPAPSEVPSPSESPTATPKPTKTPKVTVTVQTSSPVPTANIYGY